MFFKDDNRIKVNQNAISTFIGADTKIEGTLITHTSVRIDGTVLGGVNADGTIVLSQTGQIEGNVYADNIVVAGVVDGNLTIKDKTNIEPTGEVYGDINTARILIDEQSVFQGKCNMNIDRSKVKKGKLKLREVPDLSDKPEEVAEKKPEKKAEAAVEKKTEIKTETKAETAKAETKPESKVETKPENKPESKPEIKPEAKA